MKKNCRALCFLFVLIFPLPGAFSQESGEASKTIAEMQESGHWVMSGANGIKIVGIAGRKANKKEAFANALMDAARKAALYHGVSGKSEIVLKEGSNLLDYFSNVTYQLKILNEDAVETYLDKLEFDIEKDTLEKNGNVYILVNYSGVSNTPVYKSVFADGVPAWVKQGDIEITGYLTGIGMSKKKGTEQSTHQASYENAIASLLPKLHSTVKNEIIDVQGAKFTSSVTVNEGSLTEIVILEVWLDKKTASLWTLLAAKEKK